MATLAFLEGLSQIKIRNHHCLTALFDICIQQGEHYRVARQIRRHVELEQPGNEIQLTQIVVEERAKKATKKCRVDYLCRRLGIRFRQPRRVTLDGEFSLRVNQKLYLLEDDRVSGVGGYLHPPLLRNTG